MKKVIVIFVFLYFTYMNIDALFISGVIRDRASVFSWEDDPFRFGVTIIFNMICIAGCAWLYFSKKVK